MKGAQLTELHRLARQVETLVYTNPFSPERIAVERAVLGADFVEEGGEWNLDLDLPRRLLNVERICERVKATLQDLRGMKTPQGAQVIEPLLLFHLFHEQVKGIDKLMASEADPGHRQRSSGRLFRSFLATAGDWACLGANFMADAEAQAALFANFFQLRRAFFQISRSLAGRSPAMAALRASIWESIFTRDMRRYRRALIGRMVDMPTLITGPTGTGKELVARAIGLSRYIPFDARQGCFTEDFFEGFYPLNLSALSPTLIESELFGHRKGAFTGAYANHAGWLEACTPYGAVFLDEIGELESSLQVKLLRVLQSRTFQRIGEHQPQRFDGKIIAATNRDLRGEMAAGRFREDFYFRLCADQIRTPSLAEQVAADPQELAHLVLYLARRVVGAEEAPSLADEVLSFIDRHLGQDYPWPGNFRELEQCLRNILIRGAYHPLIPPAATASAQTLTLEQAMREHCRKVYAKCGNYEEAGRQLGVDRRTVRRYVHGP